MENAQFVNKALLSILEIVYNSVRRNFMVTHHNKFVNNAISIVITAPINKLV
jgi:hypothetical protein